MTAPGLAARLIGAARHQAITTAVISGALFIAQGGVGRRFGSQGLGEYTAISLSIYVASALASIAIPVTAGRDSAFLEERHQHGAAARLVGAGLLALLGLALVGGLALALVWERALSEFVGSAVVAAPVIAVAVVAAAVGAYSGRIFQSRLDIATAGLIALAQPFAVIVALGWDTYSPGIRPGQMAVAGYLLTGVIGGAGLLATGSGPRLDLPAAISQVRISIAYAPLSYVNHLAGLVDRFVVSVVLGPVALGTYQAATLFVEGSLRVLQGGVSFFVSAYGRAAARGEEHGARLQRMSLRLWATYAALVAGALIASADGIIRIIYGSLGPEPVLREFGGGPVGPLRVLAAGLIPTVVALTLLTAGAGTGRRGTLLIARLAIPAQVVVGVLLTSSLGVIGMAVAQILIVVPVAAAQMYWSRDPSLLPTRGLGLRLAALAVIVPAIGFLTQLAPVPWVLRAAVAGGLCGGLAIAILLGDEERWVLARLFTLRTAPTATGRT